MSEDCARGRGSRGTGSVTRGATSRAHLRASRTSAASASAGSPGRTVAPGVRERRQLSKGARGRGSSDTAWAPCSTKSWVFRNGRSCQVRKDGLSPRRADSERPASPWRGGQVDVSAAADVIPGPREPRARVRDADGSDGIEEPSLAGDRGPQRRVQVEASVKALLVQTRMSPSPGVPTALRSSTRARPPPEVGLPDEIARRLEVPCRLVQESPAVLVHAMGRPSRRRLLASSVRRLSQSLFRTGMSDTVIPNFSDRQATSGPVRSISGQVRSKPSRTTATSRSEPWCAVPLAYEPYRIRLDSWGPYSSCSPARSSRSRVASVASDRMCPVMRRGTRFLGGGA
jgi:hypothetical protein